MTDRSKKLSYTAFFRSGTTGPQSAGTMSSPSFLALGPEGVGEGDGDGVGEGVASASAPASGVASGTGVTETPTPWEGRTLTGAVLLFFPAKWASRKIARASSTKPAA